MTPNDMYTDIRALPRDCELCGQPSVRQIVEGLFVCQGCIDTAKTLTDRQAQVAAYTDERWKMPGSEQSKAESTAFTAWLVVLTVTAFTLFGILVALTWMGRRG